MTNTELMHMLAMLSRQEQKDKTKLYTVIGLGLLASGLVYCGYKAYSLAQQNQQLMSGFAKSAYALRKTTIRLNQMTEAIMECTDKTIVQDREIKQLQKKLQDKG